MKETQHTIKFWPFYSQFVLYDVKTPYDPEMVPHFNGPGEYGDNPLRISIRRLEVSIGLLQDGDVEITLTTHAQMPAPPPGTWTQTVSAPLELPGGILGVADIIHDTGDPELAIDLGPGRLMLRAFGRIVDEQQVFAVQIWPA
jgi:hypothetical protein